MRKHYFYSFFCLISLILCVGTTTTVEAQSPRNSMTFDASLEEVVKKLTNCSNYPTLFPVINKSLQLSKGECYLENKTVSGLYWVQTKMTITEETDGKEILVQASKGNVKNFSFTVVLKRLEPKKTEVKMFMTAKIAGIPQTLIDTMVDMSIENALKNLQSLISIKNKIR